MKNVLLLKAGEAAVSVRRTVGDYDRWFLEAIGRAGYRFDIIPAYLGQKLPGRPREYDAILMTGSPQSVVNPSEWMIRAGDYLRGAADRGVAVLGVCFGHQLLAYAYGSKVILNPQGRETGTVEIELSEAGRKDPLFRGVPARFFAQATHEDILARPPQGAKVLAGNANTAVQAMALGERVRGVQFHPELSPAGMQAVIQARSVKLEHDARARGVPAGERVRGLLAGIRSTPHSHRLLSNFLRGFT